MRKILTSLLLGVVVLGGMAFGVWSAQPAHAITWTELKCQYLPDHPACKAIQKPPTQVPENKNNG